MNTQENNKLIAEFMGIVYPKLDNVIVVYNVVIKEDDLEYHESWAWLMPVVDKIEDMGCEVVMTNEECTISGNDCYVESIGKSRRGATYKAVVEFIKQYNTECDTCKGKGWIDTYNTNTNTQEIQRCDECKVFASDKRKVLITRRDVYHKIAKVEIEIPLNVKNDDVSDYLIENEELWVNEIDEMINASDYEYGFGLEGNGMNEKDQESECRYDIVNENYGGHI